ncbi:hypothetical protein F511_23936 [Dorcoceras hygrometricum]|uniref:Uncharacterized protein n=1 Tax=Dorcoceras hygrometricum TaxID=472368 RepID=A0A2Z7A9F0_9LAMI|nr:hypothetical protein F511_23936 [Dorcoceras hygrometricum]
MTNSARTETPQRGGRNKSGEEAAARGWPTCGVWVGREERWAAVCVWRLGIQLAVGPQPLWLRNHNFGLAQRIMVKSLATSPHDPLGITDSACKNQLVMVSVQYGPFNTYIPIRSTNVGKSRVARDPITMHTSWRSNSDITSVTSIGYPRMKASVESSTTKHRLLHASGPHPIPPPNDPNIFTSSSLLSEMGASFFVKAMKVDFASVLAMEHTGMVRMFKTLEDTWLKGFLEASGSVYEDAVVELFANAKFVAGTIIISIANRKLVLTKEVIAEAFGLTTEGLVDFLDISSKTVAEMHLKFCTAGSFDLVTSEKFDLMVAISAALKVNWAQVLFQILVAMVNTPTKQSQGFAVQVSVLLQNLVKADLGELVKLHTQKVLNNKSVHTYIKKNQNVVPTGESSKRTEDTSSETEGGQSQMTRTVDKEVENAVGKKKKKIEKFVQAGKKQKVVKSTTVEAESKAAPVKSKSGTSSDADSCLLSRLNKGGAKRKLVVELSDSESTVYSTGANHEKVSDQENKEVHGVTVEISEQLFAETFELPVEGLSELSEIPKDLVFDARSIVSLSGEPTISVKAGSFNAITMEKFLMLTAIVCRVRINWTSILFNILKKMMTQGSKQAKGYAVQISLLLENVPNMELGESSAFPSSKILTDKTVHRYIVLNEKVGAEEVAAAPQVKKAPKKEAASKKRPASVPVAEPVVKKKRATKKKSGYSTDNVEMVAVALEAVPIQIIEPISAAPVVEPSVEEQMEATSAVPIDEDISAVEQPADVETIVEEFDEPTVEGTAEEIRPTSVDDFDFIIEQVLDETAHIEADEEDHGVVDVPLPSAGVEITKITLGQSIKIPGVDERTWYLASLPKIKPEEKGKKPLQEKDPDIRHIGDSHNDVLSRLTTLDKGLRFALLQQGEDLQKLIQNVRQDGRTLDDVQTLRFNEFRKGFQAQSAVVTADSMDFRKEFRALNAKVTSLDEQVAATRNDLLEFSAQAQETLNHITDQLSELIAYINRGGNDKKGEVSSSRPQPPPDDQNRGNGNTGGDNVRTTNIVDRFSGNMSREGRVRGRSGGNRSGYSKRRRYDSGGMFKRSFEDWLG